MKILLTGPTGFIGSNFARQALARGHQIAGLAMLGEKLPADLADARGLTWLRGSLQQAPWREIDSFGAGVCIHTAWITTPGVYLESPENIRFLETSRQFLRRARESGARHIVALGTCIEYQITREPLSEERTPVAPDTTYSRCKNELRLSLEAEAKAENFLACWTRVFYPYGPGEHPSRLCSSIIQKLAHNESIMLKTPNSTKDYIYIDDLARALLTVVEKKYSGTINLGTGIGGTVREIARTLAGMMGKPELVGEVAPAEVDPLDYVVADATRLRQLGWAPEHTLARGLQKLLAVYQPMLQQ